MYYILGILVALFSFQSLATPRVMECTSKDSKEFVLKGLAEADNGEGFKSYTMVNLENEETTVLSVGLMGEENAQGFVAFSGYSDQFSESFIQQMCPEQEKSGSIKTLVMIMDSNNTAPPICMSCFEK